MAVKLLYEKQDLANTTTPACYEAWYDVGGHSPILCKVARKRRSKGQHPQSKYLPWGAEVFIAPPSKFMGGEGGMHFLDSLTPSDMAVSGATDEWGVDEYLDACRGDAALLAERAELLMGAVREKAKRG